jgi:hypothetical protein
VEFALVSLVLYLMLAGTVEFGRLMFAANALQDVARVAARELSVAPFGAGVTLDEALASDIGRQQIFDPACLVVDLNDPAVAADPEAFFARGQSSASHAHDHRAHAAKSAALSGCAAERRHG